MKDCHVEGAHFDISSKAIQSGSPVLLRQLTISMVSFFRSFSIAP